MNNSNPRIVGQMRDLIDTDQTGWMGLFISQAILAYARKAATTDPTQIARDSNGFINGEAWTACGRAVLAELQHSKKA
jgi:hypothetical protein